ncbi:hypothetical protein EDM56_21005 [Brevibacillus fluminis]|uniref:Uncharacterized protein n=1 Tax=Brevibacillus fluminis TaxID=511487 RepID=A0A3M8D9F7_9BACL|nr:hypothetical protein [Brevibacillus fluminis]RNB84588.1 hypothetical protein EDM56_21005 [Brevibacillus fluminis]
MSENQNEIKDTAAQPGKISLQEAMKRKLAQKKQEQANGNQAGNQKASNQVMKSQQTKKPNNQRRRTGGS